MTKSMAPHLKSMTINLRPLLWYGPMLREHRVHTQTILPHYSTYRSVETDEIKNLAHRDLMVKSLVVANKKKTLPSIQQLQIVNTTGRLKHDYTCDGNENMVLPSMILSQTQPHASPYQRYISAAGELFDQVLSTPSTLIRKITHSFSGNCLRWSRKSRETWIVDQHKTRFPDSFGNSSVAKHKRFEGVSLDVSSEVTDFPYHNLNLDTPVSASEHFDLELVQRQWKIALRLKTTTQEGLCGTFSEV